MVSDRLIVTLINYFNAIMFVSFPFSIQADYLNRIINVTFITTLQYQKYLAIVDNLVEDVQPGVTVQQVGSLISNLLEEGSPLGNDTNTAVSCLYITYHPLFLMY